MVEGEKPRIVVVSGTPGVGKSTVVSHAMEMAKERGKKITLVNYGTAMFELAKSKRLAEHRDEMRKLPIETQKELQAQAAKLIRQKAEKGIIVVDTHMLINTPAGFLAGIPQWVLDALKPDMVVLIEADPERIVGRRLDDETRERDEEAVALISLHQDLCRSAAMFTLMHGSTVRIIENPPGKAEEAAKELFQVLMSE
ncbi:MAG: adenylate kinase [Candidatus Hodarchaeota archaeon]